MIDGEPGFLIHPDCKVTRKGMQGGYAFKRTGIAGEERFRDTPDKNRFSHPCEAGQYLMLGSGATATLLPQAKPQPMVTPMPVYSPLARRR